MTITFTWRVYFAFIVYVIVIWELLMRDAYQLALRTFNRWRFNRAERIRNNVEVFVSWGRVPFMRKGTKARFSIELRRGYMKLSHGDHLNDYCVTYNSMDKIKRERFYVRVPFICSENTGRESNQAVFWFASIWRAKQFQKSLMKRIDNIPKV